jgi:hypothetical protein
VLFEKDNSFLFIYRGLVKNKLANHNYSRSTQ